MDASILVMDASMANHLNVRSAVKRNKFKENPHTPLLSLVLNRNAIEVLNLKIKQLREEQLRNNPIIANLFNTSTSKKPRQRKNSI